MVRDDVRSVVALREGAQLVVAVARTTAPAQDFWYAYVVDDVVLLEEVGADGLHRFALAAAADPPALVPRPPCTPTPGTPRGSRCRWAVEPGDPTPPDELLERLGSAILRAMRWSATSEGTVPRAPRAVHRPGGVVGDESGSRATPR